MTAKNLSGLGNQQASLFAASVLSVIEKWTNFSQEKWMRTCKECKANKPISEYYEYNGGKYHSRSCKNCMRVVGAANARRYYRENKEVCLRKGRTKYLSEKQRVFDNYGNACACCNETEPMFLSIDHIENDGHLQRRAPGRSSHNNIYGWLVRNNFPPGFQVLCANCNHGKHRNGGVCPHQEASTISRKA